MIGLHRWSFHASFMIKRFFFFGMAFVLHAMPAFTRGGLVGWSVMVSLSNTFFLLFLCPTSFFFVTKECFAHPSLDYLSCPASAHSFGTTTLANNSSYCIVTFNTSDTHRQHLSPNHFSYLTAHSQPFLLDVSTAASYLFPLSSGASIVPKA